MALLEALPVELNELIALALSNKLSLSKLNFLRLVNKTWKGAVEGGLFGPLGKLLRPELRKVALLFEDGALTPIYTHLPDALPALGIVDEATWRVHIVPLSTRSAPFDGTHKCAVLTGQSIFWISDSRFQQFKRSEATVGLSSFNLVSKLLKAYEKQNTEKVSWREHLDITNLAPLDEHRFVLFGYGFLQDPPPVGGFYTIVVVVFDSRSATWVSLPPLPDLSAQRAPSDSRCFCYVSEGRIWVAHENQLYSITSEADATTEWRQEDASVPVQPLDAPPPSFEVLAHMHNLLCTPVRYKLAILTGGQPRLLDVLAPKKGGVRQALLGALAVSGRLLLMSRNGAFLDGREVQYVWEHGAGVSNWSSRRCRVLWAAGLGGGA